jgi:hypothetical protein
MAGQVRNARPVSSRGCDDFFSLILRDFRGFSDPSAKLLLEDQRKSL